MLEYASTRTFKLAGPRQLYIEYKHNKSNKKNAVCVLFLHGLLSDMNGTKANFVESLCTELGIDFVAFDNLGHGKSDGIFSEQTIGSWLEASIAVMQHVNMPTILIGSSMGAWLALLLASNPLYNKMVHGIITLAAAPDFTENMLTNLTDSQSEELKQKGVTQINSGGYSYPISRNLLTEAKQHLLLDKRELPITCPTIFIHGSKDDVVDSRYSLTLYDKTSAEQSMLLLIKNADHRLTDPLALQTIKNSVISMTRTKAD